MLRTEREFFETLPLLLEEHGTNDVQKALGKIFSRSQRRQLRRV
jgi:hypothetical protein